MNNKAVIGGSVGAAVFALAAPLIMYFMSLI